MKTQYEDSLKKLDNDITWNEQRKQLIKKDLIEKMQNDERNHSWKNRLVYPSSIAALLFITIVGLNYLLNTEPGSTKSFIHSENHTTITLKEDRIPEFLLRKNSLETDTLKMTKDRSSWSKEEMDNDIHVGITLIYLQLKKLEEGEWIPNFDSIDDQRIISDMFNILNQTSTAIFHSQEDNWLHTDVLNLLSVLGEAAEKEDMDGFVLAYQVIHDLHVSYNGYKSEEPSYGVTLYRDATYDVVREYLGRD